MQFSKKICILITLFALVTANSFAGTTVSSKGSSSSRGSGFSSSKSSSSSSSYSAKPASKSQFGQFSQQSTTRQTNRSSAFSQDLSKNASQERARQALQAREQAARQAAEAKRAANAPYSRTSQSNQWGNQGRRDAPMYGQNRGAQNPPVVTRESRSNTGAIVTGMVLGSIFSHQNGHAQTRTNEPQQQSNKGLEPIDEVDASTNSNGGVSNGGEVQIPEPPFNPKAVVETQSKQDTTYEPRQEEGSSFFTWFILLLTIAALYAFYRYRTQRRQAVSQYHLGGS